jgi:hypothetical protein
MTSPSQERWQQLGGMLIQRRVELDARYRYRNAFADDTGLDWRLLYDIEKARRANFTRATITAIEVAYRLEPGSIEEFLDGDEDTLIPLPDPGPEPEPQPWPPERHFDDPAMQAMWDNFWNRFAGDEIPDEILRPMMLLGDAMFRNLQAGKRSA